jgi:predicted CopG family antitoxin
MSTTLRVSDATKAKLERLKRPGESWNDFLERLIAEEEPIETGAWSDERAQEAYESIRENRERTR